MRTSHVIKLSMLSDERVQIEKVVTSGGGMFSSDLRKENCTHLVAQSPTGYKIYEKYFNVVNQYDLKSGEKYSAARTWGGIWLVTRQWVDDCADMGGMPHCPESFFFCYVCTMLYFFNSLVF